MKMDLGDQKWLVVTEPRPNAPLQLLCFHHAGGGALGFRNWPSGLCADVELIAVQLPGRENRMSETPLHTASEILDQLIPHLQRVLRPNYAVFGHSLGAGLAYQLARRARLGAIPEPVRLFASASPPPVHCDAGDMDGLSAGPISDEELVEDLRRHGGTPEDLLANRAYLDLLLPILRADYGVYATLERGGDAELPMPITVIYGAEDPDLVPSDMIDWRRLSSQATEMHVLPGGHFYFQTAWTRTFQIINDALKDDLHKLSQARAVGAVT